MADQPTIHHAGEALRPQTPINFIVSGVFSEGSLSVVFGEPGAKKSYSMLDCAVCVALGKNWLNFPTTKVPVLIVDEESGIARMNQQLSAVMRAHGAGEDLRLSYCILEGFDLRGTKDRKKLRDLIVKTEAKFVLIDALADLFPEADENAVRDILPGLRALRTICNSIGVAILLIHHAGKNGRYRGSSSIKGSVDLMLEIESKPDSPNIDFTCEKARDLEPFSFSAVANFDDDLFSLIPSVRSKGGDLNKAEKFALEYFRGNGDSPIDTVAEAAELKGICKFSSARKAAFALAKRKKVERKDGGKSGSKAVYGLSNPDLFDVLEQMDD